MTKLEALLRSIRRFFTLGVDGDDPDPAAPPEGGDPDPASASADGGGDDDFDALLARAESEIPEPAAPSKSRREIELEAELATARAQLSSRPSPAMPAAPTVDPEAAREDAELAAMQQRGASEEELRWARWQVNLQRENRATKRNADEALRSARDVNDRTEFAALAATNPKIYAKYQSRVEEFVANLRQSGQSAPRLAVLRFLIGEDVMKGVGKPPKTKAAAPAGVPRGQPAPMRSDASRTSAKSDREKRAARLEGVRL